MQPDNNNHGSFFNVRNSNHHKLCCNLSSHDITCLGITILGYFLYKITNFYWTTSQNFLSMVIWVSPPLKVSPGVFCNHTPQWRHCYYVPLKSSIRICINRNVLQSEFEIIRIVFLSISMEWLCFPITTTIFTAVLWVSCHPVLSSYWELELSIVEAQILIKKFLTLPEPYHRLSLVAKVLHHPPAHYYVLRPSSQLMTKEFFEVWFLSAAAKSGQKS